MTYNDLEWFCEGPFWNTSLLVDNTWPEFTPCFIHTFLVWVPCGYVWLLLPYFLYDVNNESSTNNLQPVKMAAEEKADTTTSDISDSHVTSSCGCFKVADTTTGKFTTVCVLKMIFTGLLAVVSLIHFLLDMGDHQFLAEILSSPVYTATYVLIVVQLWYERRRGREAMFIPFYFFIMNIIFGIVPFYTLIITQDYQTDTGKFSLATVSLIINCVCFILTCLPDNIWGSVDGYHHLGPNMSPEITASYFAKVSFWCFAKLILVGFRKEITPDDVYDLHPRDQGHRLNPLFERYWKQEVARVNKINTSRFSYVNVSLDNNLLGQNEAEITKKQMKRSPKNLEDDSQDHQTYNRGLEKTFLLGKQQHKIFGTWTQTKTPEMKTELPNLVWVLWRLQWKNILVIIIQKIASDLALFSGPLVLGILIQSLEQSEASTQWQPYVITLVLLAFMIARSVLFSNANFRSLLLSLQIRTILISAIYKKALMMPNSARKAVTVGEIVNLISVDCQRLQDNLMWFGFMISFPVQFLLAFGLLYLTIGPASLAGLVTFLLTLPIIFWILRYHRTIQDAILLLKDKQIRNVTEILNAMKVLKLYAWEDQFKKKVEAIRAQEINQLYKGAFAYAAFETLTFITPFLIGVVTFTTFTLIDQNNVLDSKKAFVSLAVFNLLRIPAISLKVVSTYSVQLHISIKRITTFLTTGGLIPKNSTVNTQTGVNVSEQAISIRKGTFAWDINLQPILLNINADFAYGKLTAVVGAVGSGKSSLISAVLGEMERIHGQVSVNGTVAYVSQQAWIQNATIRENILFGKAFNKHRYSEVIKVCELERDLQILEAGDQTEIGEKGINLSGGQKQRVSLARAVYSDSDIYLLDDPLSAVDAHVGKAIFKNVISNSGFLAGKTRVLVTHGVHWLPQMDNILVLTNGVISENGSYDELISHKGPFAQFLQTYLLDPNNRTNDDSDFISDDDEDKPVRSEVKIASPVTFDADGSPVNSPAYSTKAKSSHRKHHLVKRQDSEDKKHCVSEPDRCSKSLSFSEDTSEEGKLIVDEILLTGKANFKVFLTVAQNAGFCALFIAFICYVLNMGFLIWSSFFLTTWTNDPLLLNSTSRTSPDGKARLDYYLAMYGAFFGFIQLITSGLFVFLLWTRLVHASGKLHQQLLNRIIHAPMQFFDQTPLGRILNRFSKDVDTLDIYVPLFLTDVMGGIRSVLSSVVVTVILAPTMVTVFFPIGVLFFFLQKYSMRITRQLKRIESITRSPLFAHLSESYTGAAVIRAYRAMDRFIQECEQKVDKNQMYTFACQAIYSWLPQQMDILVSVVVFFSVVFLMLSSGGGSDVGLSVSYTLQMSLFLNFLVRQFSELETSTVSIERLKEYCEIEQEAMLINSDNRPPSSWPVRGDVSFTDYQLRYREGLDLVLKGITCHIHGGEKIGVVGRTGAGKSTLTLSLFRIIEAAGGAIIIDGINIADIGLHDLRSKLTILPQDPVVFSGSLRDNLDPFEEYSDQQLWTALERSHLKEFVAAQPEGLSFECNEEGANLSVGQRQLMCLTRSLLRHTKILILDEATAAVDMETDALIQKTIKEAFSDCTIITIAHRLNTIMDHDKIIVMDAGTICEFDTPSNLISSRGMFYNMCKDAGLV